MTKRKNILAILLSLFVAFSMLGIVSLLVKPSEKAQAAIANPLRYDGVTDPDQTETYYRAHWRNGQDSRVTGETSGRWSFGNGDVAGTTLTYTKATFDASNVGYTTGVPNAFFWTQTTTTMTYSTSHSQSLFVWEAENPGDVHITGLFSRANTVKQTLLATQNNVDGGSVWLPFWADDPQYGWVDGESYTLTMWRIGADGTGGEIWSETYTAEYAKLINEIVNVNTGDKVVIGLRANSCVNDWDTNTLTLLSSQFTAGEYVKPIAPLTPAYVFGNNMVLQRNKAVNVYGYGEPEKTVTVTYADQEKTATIDANGYWKVSLDAMDASTVGRTMTITDGVSTITYNNVVVGEVWYCSGQSNMQYTLGQLLIDRGYSESSVWQDHTVDYATSPIKDYTSYTNYNKLRIYTQDFCSSTTIQTLGVQNQWMKNGWATPQNLTDALGFSAYATGFALMLQKGLGEDVPVGIVVSAIGGTSVEEWLSQATIDANNLSLHYQGIEGEKIKCLLYNGMTAPLNDVTVGGFLWYQGCADAGHGDDTTTQKWVADWKASVKALVGQFRASHGNVPFISQSLAQCKDWVPWKYIRQANYELMKEVDGFYAVNGINYGVPYDTLVTSNFANYIHPADKYGNSRDAAHIALTNIYEKSGYNGVAEYPVSVYKAGGNTYIEFEEGVQLKLSEGNTVNNLTGATGGVWGTITNATVSGNYILIPGTSYTHIAYGAYNIMMPNSTSNSAWNSAHGTSFSDSSPYDNIYGAHNSGSMVNLYTTKSGLPDLAVFPVLVMGVSETGSVPPTTYTLNYTNDSTKGTITGIESGSYVAGTTLTGGKITANSIYVISSVKINGVEQLTQKVAQYDLNVTIDSNTTIVVEYTEKTSFSATLTSDTAQGTVTGYRTGIYYEGDVLEIVITAKAGYTIKSVKWNGVDETLTDNTTLTLNRTIAGETTLEVEYEVISYQLAINYDNTKINVVIQNSITVGAIAHGTNVIINVSPISAEYEISSITVNGEPYPVISGTTVININKFTQDTTIEITATSLSIIASVNSDTSKGTVSGLTQGEELSLGQTVDISISAEEGFIINAITWNGSNIEITNKKEMAFSKVIDTAGASLVVTYNVEQFTLTLVNDSEKGSVMNFVNGATVASGSNLIVMVSAKSGYKIASISWNGQAITVTNDQEMSFEKQVTSATTLTITYEAVGGDSGSGSGDSGSGSGSQTPSTTKCTITKEFDKTMGSVGGVNATVDKGTTVNIRISAKEGYQIKSVKIDGKEQEITDGSQMTISYTVNKNIKIVVEFEEASSGCGSTLTSVLPVGIIALTLAGAMLLIKKGKQN